MVILSTVDEELRVERAERTLSRLCADEETARAERRAAAWGRRTFVATQGWDDAA